MLHHFPTVSDTQVNMLRINFWISQVNCLMNIVLEEYKECQPRILRSFIRKTYTSSVLRQPTNLTSRITRPLEVHKTKLFHLQAPSQVVNRVKEKLTGFQLCILDYPVKVEVERNLDSYSWNQAGLQPLETLEQTCFTSTRLEWPKQPSRRTRGHLLWLLSTCPTISDLTRHYCHLTSRTRMPPITWMALAI